VLPDNSVRAVNSSRELLLRYINRKNFLKHGRHPSITFVCRHTVCSYYGPHTGNGDFYSSSFTRPCFGEDRDDEFSN